MVGDFLLRFNEDESFGIRREGRWEGLGDCHAFAQFLGKQKSLLFKSLVDKRVCYPWQSLAGGMLLLRPMSFSASMIVHRISNHYELEDQRTGIRYPSLSLEESVRQAEDLLVASWHCVHWRMLPWQWPRFLEHMHF